MMKTITYVSCISVLLASFSSFAEPSSEHVSKASKHSALALAHGAAGSVQVASGVVAVPLLVAGSVAVSVGEASVDMGKDMSKVASHSPSQNKDKKVVELEITEITITVDRSPAQAMEKDQ